MCLKDDLTPWESGVKLVVKPKKLSQVKELNIWSSLVADLPLRVTRIPEARG